MKSESVIALAVFGVAFVLAGVLLPIKLLLQTALVLLGVVFLGISASLGASRPSSKRPPRVSLGDDTRSGQPASPPVPASPTGEGCARPALLVGGAVLVVSALLVALLILAALLLLSRAPGTA